VRFHGTQRHHGRECLEQRARRADERVCRPRLPKMRAFLGDKRELAKQLAALEKELKQRLDIHEAAIVTILQRMMDINDPPSPAPVLAKTEDSIQTMKACGTRR
jgi:hypothetical protein